MRNRTPELIGDAIIAMLCMVACVTLAPLAKTLRDEGAPEWFALIFLMAGGIAFLGMLYFLYRMVRHARA